MLICILMCNVLLYSASFIISTCYKYILMSRIVTHSRNILRQWQRNQRDLKGQLMIEGQIRSFCVCGTKASKEERGTQVTEIVGSSAPSDSHFIFGNLTFDSSILINTIAWFWGLALWWGFVTRNDRLAHIIIFSPT